MALLRALIKSNLKMPTRRYAEHPTPSMTDLLILQLRQQREQRLFDLGKDRVSPRELCRYQLTSEISCPSTEGNSIVLGSLPVNRDTSSVTERGSITETD